MSIVYTEHFTLPQYDKKEILRYCGMKQSDPRFDELLNDCLAEVKSSIQGKVCYSEFNITEHSGKLDLAFCKTESELLKKQLADCNKIILFAATTGIVIDRLIAKYGYISPAKALIFDSIGAERVEALCDAFEAKLKAEGKAIKPRVSAGYGDIPLDMQKDIFNALDCPKNIGLTLNDSLLMSPAKSVTAIIGIRK